MFRKIFLKYFSRIFNLKDYEYLQRSRLDQLLANYILDKCVCNILKSNKYVYTTHKNKICEIPKQKF